MSEIRTYVNKGNRTGCVETITRLTDGTDRVRVDTFKGGVRQVSSLYTTAEAQAHVREMQAVLEPTPPPPPPPPAPTGWKEVFRDTFDRDVPEGSFRTMRADQWTCYEDAWPDMSKVGVRDARGISQSGGLLRIHHHLNAQGKAMVPAIMPKLPSGTGVPALRWEFRMKADPLPNYYCCPLLWPDSENWPHDGEIDWPEGGYTGLAGCFMHRQDGTSGSDQDSFASTAKLADWHTYALEWIAGERLTLFLDDVQVKEWTSRVPATLMHPVFQTETYPGKGQPPASQDGFLLVEYVAISVPA